MTEFTAPTQKMEFHEINYEKGILNIGSHPENDIVVQDPNVMPFHLMIDFRQSPYLVVSLNPDADIKVDGVALTDNETAEVMDISQVSFSGYSMNLIQKNGGNGGAKLSIISPEFNEETISTPANFSPSVASPAAVTNTPNTQHPITSKIDFVPTSDVILVEIHELKQTINVEQTAIFPLTIINGGSIVASFDVQVDGVPQEWVKITPERVNLNEGGRGRVEIQITPPRNPESEAGDYPVLIKVASSNYPGQVGGDRVELTINPYYEFAVGNLNPRYKSVSFSKNSAITHYPIINQGNSVTNYLVMAQDDENGCKFEFQTRDEVFLAKQAEISVRPGEEIDVPVRIMPVKRNLVRLRPRQYQYNVTTQSMNEAAASRIVSGTFVSRPLLGIFSILMAIILLLLSAFFILRPRIIDFNVVEDVIALGDPAVLNWKVSPFTTNIRIEGANQEISGSQNQIEVVPDDTAETYTLVAGNWLSRMLRMEDVRSKPITVLAIPPAPEISTFFVDKTRIFEGDDITIKWSIANADEAYLTVDGIRTSLTPQEMNASTPNSADGVLASLVPQEFNNERTVTLRNDSLIVLEAKNDSGSQFQSEFIHAQKPTIVIEEFSLSDTTIIKGEPVTIIWKVSGIGVENVMIAPFEEVYPLEGELTFFPEASMEFVLTVKNRDLEQIRLLPIGVLEPGAEPQPPTVEFFKVAPEEIVGSGAVEFSWSVSGVQDRIEISSIDGVVLADLPAQGFKSFNVNNTTSYVLTAYNGDLSSAAILEVTVNPTKKNAYIEINKIVPDTVINRGDSVMVYYSVYAADATGKIVDPVAMGWPELSGSVVVTDGFDTCEPVDLPVHACELTLNTSEKNKQITATYSGDENYVRKSSAPYPVGLDVVGETAVFDEQPKFSDNPVVIGQATKISFVISPENPVATSPITGKVNVVDKKGETLCIVNLTSVDGKPMSAQGGCTVTFLDEGKLNLFLSYTGNDIYDGIKDEISEQLQVDKAPTEIDLFISSVPTVVGQPLKVDFLVKANTPGDIVPAGIVDILIEGEEDVKCSATLNSLGKGSCNLVIPTVGTKNIIGRYYADDNFEPSETGIPYYHTVNQASTTTIITSFSPTTNSVGQATSISFRVSAISPGSGVPTGNVRVIVGAEPVCPTVKLNKITGEGSCSVIFKKSGAQSITVEYLDSEDPNYLGSQAINNNYQVTPAKTSTFLNFPDPTPSALGETVTFSFAVSLDPSSTNPDIIPSGQAVVEASTGEKCDPNPTLNADGFGTCTITFLSEGKRSVKVKYLGTVDYLSSESTSIEHTVKKDSKTSIVNVEGDLVVGNNILFSVSVVPDPPGGNVPTGTVTLVSSPDGNTCTTSDLDTNGKGSCSIKFETSGDKSIVATYSGSKEYVSSSSAAKLLTISKASTTTEITSDHSITKKVGESVLVSVKVNSSVPAPATGKVEVYFVGSTEASEKCEVNLSSGTGSCSLTLKAAGAARQIEAKYLGNDDKFSGSTSAIVTQKVDPAPTNIEIIDIDPTTIKVKQEVTFKVRVRADTLNTLRPGGSFQIQLSDNTVLCSGTLDATTSEGNCKYTFFTQGTRTVKAVYVGTTNYLTSTSSTENITVGRADSSVNINLATNPSYLNQEITIQVTVNPSSVGDVLPTGKVDFVASKDGSTDLECKNVVLVDAKANCKITPNSVGEWTIKVDYEGDANYLSSSNTVTQTVQKLTSSTNVTVDPTPSVLGQQVAINVAVVKTSIGSGTLGGTVNITAELEGATDLTCAISINTSGVGSCNLTFNALGTWSLKAVYSGNTDFGGSEGSNTHLVNKVPTKTTITLINPTPSVTGQSVAVSVKVERDGVTGDEPSGTVTVNAQHTGGQVVNCSSGITLNSSGSGSCNITFPVIGTWTIKAYYQGTTSTYISSTSVGTSHTVNQADTTTTVSVPTTAIVVGQAFDVSASVIAKSPGSGTPTGSVSISATKTGATTQTCQILLSSTDKKCGISLPVVGDWTITATYNGDVNFKTSNDSENKTVNQATTSLSITTTPRPSSIGQTVNVIFDLKVVSPGTGTPTGTITATATAKVSGTDYEEECTGSVIGGSCSFILTPAGSWTISATYSGDANYKTITSANVTHTVQ